jgi:hypothetical protein
VRPAAALALVDHIGQQTVACDQRDVDRYGRIVAVCRAGADDLNAWLVAQGWALAYRQYSTAYVDEEAAAKAAGRPARPRRAGADLGMWRGAFTAPWDWRHGVRTPTASAGASAPEPAATCCKVCTTGKACGNSCISRKKTCHKPPGCACDAQ